MSRDIQSTRQMFRHALATLAYRGGKVLRDSYDATGHMSVQIMRLPHPKVASGDDENVAPGEKVALFDAYIAYFGTYSVDWKAQVLTHRVEGDLADVYVGTAQKRHFELQGDLLTLSDTGSRGGRAVQGKRVFERVRNREH